MLWEADRRNSAECTICTSQTQREDLRFASIDQSRIMQTLDLVIESYWLVLNAGRSALSLLPRASMLAGIFGWDD